MKSKLYKKCVSTFLSLTVSATILPINVHANNILENHWAKEAILNFESKGYLREKYTTLDILNKYITRAEFISIFNKIILAEKESSKIDNFIDINKNDWFYSDISKALEVGYISGTSKNTISPNKSITREEAFVIIGRYLKLEQSQNTKSYIRDKENISNFAKGYTISLINKGYLKGNQNKEILPKNKITHAEAIILLYRIKNELIPNANDLNKPKAIGGGGSSSSPSSKNFSINSSSGSTTNKDSAVSSQGEASNSINNGSSSENTNSNSEANNSDNQTGNTDSNSSSSGKNSSEGISNSNNDDNQKNNNSNNKSENGESNSENNNSSSDYYGSSSDNSNQNDENSNSSNDNKNQDEQKDEENLKTAKNKVKEAEESQQRALNLKQQIESDNIITNDEIELIMAENSKISNAKKEAQKYIDIVKNESEKNNLENKLQNINEILIPSKTPDNELYEPSVDSDPVVIQEGSKPSDEQVKSKVTVNGNGVISSVNIPDDTSVGDKTATVTVTYDDNTSDIVSVNIRYTKTPDNELYEPSVDSDPVVIQEGSKPSDEQVKSKVTVNGNGVISSVNIPDDTSVGDKTATVTVTYDDNTSDVVSVNIRYTKKIIKNNANWDTYTAKDGSEKRILWVKGINPPKMGEDGNFIKSNFASYEEYKAPYILGQGWYDTNKRNSGNDRVDSSLCFAGVATNMMYWWLDQNESEVSEFINYLTKKGYFDDKEEGTLEDLRFIIAGERPQQQNRLYNKFVNHFFYRKEGFQTDILIDFFINGYTPKENGGTNDEFDDFILDKRAGYFNEVFSNQKLTDRMFSGNINYFSSNVKKALEKDSIIGLEHTVGSKSFSHIVTLWGAEFDDNGKITAIYVTDTDDEDEENKLGMKRYIVRNINGRVKISTNIDNPNVGSNVEYLHILKLEKEKFRNFIDNLEK